MRIKYGAFANYGFVTTKCVSKDVHVRILGRTNVDGSNKQIDLDITSFFLLTDSKIFY